MQTGGNRWGWEQEKHSNQKCPLHSTRGWEFCKISKISYIQLCIASGLNDTHLLLIHYRDFIIQVNKKFDKFERVYRDCIKRTRDKTRIHCIPHDAPGT